jgi:hypothetical protein
LTPHEFLRKNPGTVVIAASRYAADDLVRKACDSALLGIQRYTFRGLVYALSTDAMNARGVTPVRRIAREAIAAAVARKVDLKYLPDIVRFPGFRPPLPKPFATSASIAFRSRNSAIPGGAPPISLSSSS